MKKRKKTNERLIDMNLFKLIFIILIIPLFSCAKGENNILDEEAGMYNLKKNESIVYEINDLFHAKKTKEAFYLISSYSHKFNVDEKVGVGAILYSNGYYKLSKSYFEDASFAGNPEAFYRLGYFYNYNEDEKDVELAIKYFNLSIEAGYLSSYINLGEIYLFEDGFVSLSTARFNFKKAVSLGFMNGYYGLGEINLREGNFYEAKNDFEKLKKYGYLLEYYDGCVNLYSKYEDSEFYDIDLAKKYIDLIILLIDDPRKYEIIADFYKGDHKYRDLNKSNYYSELEKY